MIMKAFASNMVYIYMYLSLFILSKLLCVYINMYISPFVTGNGLYVLLWNISLILYKHSETKSKFNLCITSCEMLCFN